MNIEHYFPAAPLKPFVKCYMIVDCKEEVLNSMLPDTSLIMGFRYKGSTHYLENNIERRLPFTVVAGLRKSIQLMKDAKDTANLLVIFNAAGANAFIKEPLYQLFGEIVSLQDCSGYHNLNEVEEKLSLVRTNLQRIQIIEQFLYAKLYDYKSDPLVLAAMQIIKANNGFVKVRELCRQLYISVDAFEKRFRRVTGASPKQFSNIIRMNAIVNNIAGQNFVETALNAGYYDQAHFNKDFKLFTGKTPTDFLKNRVL